MERQEPFPTSILGLWEICLAAMLRDPKQGSTILDFIFTDSKTWVSKL